jgi:adenylate cyclase
MTAPRGSGPSGDPFERLVGFGEPTLDNERVCELGGADRDVADRLWRALGFPDVPEGEPAFTDEDARALRLATEGLEQMTGDRRGQALELMLHEARVISASLANLAELELDAIGALIKLGLRQKLLADAIDRGIENSDFGWLILYVLRHQLAAAVRRRAPAAARDGWPRQRLAVGFVDLVGFTELIQQLDTVELGQLLGRFESLAFDVVTEAGGRVVKLIGDEAMFVCPHPAHAVRAALEILDSGPTVDLPPARAGISFGDLLLQAGDCFGSPVNLASRIVDRAPSGAVIVDEQTAKLIQSEPDLALEALPDAPLKGIGTVPLWRASPRNRP